MAVKYKPAGFHTVTPYLTVEGVDKLINFLQRTFDAKVLERIVRNDGTVANPTIRIGDSVIMTASAGDEYKAAPSSLYVYVADTDETYKKALEAGGKSLMEPADMFYGDRNAGVMDVCGNSWWFATHIEDVTEAEVQQRENNRQPAAV